MEALVEFSNNSKWNSRDEDVYKNIVDHLKPIVPWLSTCSPMNRSYPFNLLAE